TEKKKVFHSYSDDLNAEIQVYSLEEIFAEKIRALIQRTRARDLYDAGMLYDLINKNKVLQILDEKFDFKGVILDISSLTKRKDDFSNAWDASLNHQLKVIPDFEIFFNSRCGNTIFPCFFFYLLRTNHSSSPNIFSSRFIISLHLALFGAFSGIVGSSKR
ncbi:unnamed protein product, partial [marine sediment metagenome]